MQKLFPILARQGARLGVASGEAWVALPASPERYARASRRLAWAKRFGGAWSLVVAAMVASTQGAFAEATGGDVTTNSGYIIHTFTNSGTFTVSGGTLNCDVLVVAGGGEGGYDVGGGGGAGGLIYSNAFPVAVGSLTVTVGAGGFGAASYGQVGRNGSNSIFSTITATGGGGGGSYNGGSGANGGSGGGGSGYVSPGNPGNGTVGQGNNGGLTGSPSTSLTGSGGGGAGGVGGTGVQTNNGFAAGGVGLAYSISGASVTYATGGKGGGDNWSGPVAGAASTGNGGDGAGNNGVKAGGSGIVIVRYVCSPGYGPNTNLPFSDDFEAYPNLYPLDTGTNGWYGSSSNIIVQVNTVRTGTKAAMIPVDCTLSNRFTGIPPTNVWVQMDMRPTLYNSTNPPVVDNINVAAMFYINSNGNFVVHNGPATNPSPTNSSSWVTLTNGGIGTNGTNWVTVGIYEDFSTKSWDLYTNSTLVTNNIGFINMNLTNFAGFDIYNGATTSYLDNVMVTASNRTPAGTATNTSVGYWSPSTNMVVSNTFTTGSSLTNLTWTPTFPATNWTLNSASGEGSPSVSGTNIVFAGPLTTPVKFTYTVNVPGNAAVSNELHGTVTYRFETAGSDQILALDPLTVYRYHSADYQSPTRKIDGVEASRVLAYWRDGGYYPKATTLDRYAPTNSYAGDTNAGLHSADYENPRWQIDADEMNRVLVYWRADGYHVDLAGADGYAADLSGPGPMFRMFAFGWAKLDITPAVVLSGPTNYNPGETLTITCTFSPSDAKLLGLVWKPQVPTGWTVVSVSGDSDPELARGEILSLSSTLPTTPIQIIYTVQVPESENRTCPLGLAVNFTSDGMVNPATLNATPIIISPVEPIPSPTITANPQSVTANEGESATFGVSASGMAPLFYQWQKKGVNIGGATATNYVIALVSTNDAGGYYCLVTNTVGSATSQVATLIVVTTRLLPPSGVDATKGVYTNKVRVTWQGVEHATSHDLLRSTNTSMSGASHLADIPANIDTSYFYDDTAVQSQVSYYYWVWAKAGDVAGPASYVAMGYAALGSATRSADIAVSDMIFLPVNMTNNSSAETVSCRLANLGPDALNAAGVAFDFHMGSNDSAFIWIGSAQSNMTLSAGGEELIILTPSAKRGLTVRGDLSGVQTVQVTVRHLSALNDPNLANNTTTAAGSVRIKTSGVNSSGRSLNDYDGDGKADGAIYRGSDGRWVATLSGARYGAWLVAEAEVAGLTPVPGDYDGDGITDMAVYESSSGWWGVLLSSNGQLVSFPFGGPDFVAVPCDFDGDAITDPIVYREADGYWAGAASSRQYVLRETILGVTGYQPVPSDYDGDGLADPAVYNRETGFWAIGLSSVGYQLMTGLFGGIGYLPVSTDYDGDGLADPAVYAPGTAYWQVLMSGTLSTKGYYTWWGGVAGNINGIPVPADYDGDGLADPAVYHQDTTGLWELFLSTLGYQELSGGFGGPEYQPATE